VGAAKHSPSPKIRVALSQLAGTRPRLPACEQPKLPRLHQPVRSVASGIVCLLVDGAGVAGSCALSFAQPLPRRREERSESETAHPRARGSAAERRTSHALAAHPSAMRRARSAAHRPSALIGVQISDCARFSHQLHPSSRSARCEVTWPSTSAEHVACCC
jgi:hypothetical protein